jgi:PAS domain S-box-containing protein
MIQHSSVATTGSTIDYNAIFESRPGNSIVLLPDAPKFTVIAVSNDFAHATGIKREDLIGKGHFEMFPQNPDDVLFTGEHNMRASFDYVLTHKEPHLMPQQRYDLLDGDGTFTEKYWKAYNVPVLNNRAEVLYIIHTSEDITALVKAEQKEEEMKGIEKAYNLFMSAPVIIGILHGDHYVIELANEGLLEVWGRTSDVIGKPLLEAIPELKEQGFIALLDQVRITGEPFYAHGFPITLNRSGEEEVLYFDFVYKPIYNNSERGIASGIISVGYDVTAQVMARKKAKESEAKYRSLFESMDQGFCVLEMIFDQDNHPIDYRFLETNPVFEQQTGLKDAIGKTARELVPDLESRWFDLYGTVALRGEPIRFTEGSETMGRWFDVYAFSIGDSASRKVALLFTDISERKRAEELNRKSEQNLRNTILQAPVAMAILKGPRFIVEIANKRMYELWGRGEAELLGKSIFDGLPEVRDQGYEGLLTGVYTTGERFTALGIPVTLPRNGIRETVYINLLYEAFKEVDGTISGVIAVAYDVSDQVLARIKVEDANKEFQFVTDFMPQMIWVTRPDGYHYYYNKQWYDYTGLTYEETKGKGWNTVFHPEDQQRAWEAWNHSLNTGEPYEIEYRCRRYDGIYRWVLGRALPLKDATGTILKWFGTCTDIDDQKRANEVMEQRIEERTQELQQVNNQLKQFTYAASHDLQEPLRKIGFFLDMLMNQLGPDLAEENKSIAVKIQHTTERMRNLIDDLLDYSNTELGVMGLGDVNLTNLLYDVLEDMEAIITQKGATINLQELPVVKGDSRQLRQMFQNLISNALKYHKSNTSPQVNISAQRINGKDVKAEVPQEKSNMFFYLIQIKDNGIGFDQTDAKRIFHLFQRLHGRKEYEGTGVGLSLVQKVVENHKGFIWAESTPGEGATFSILLPVE